MAKKSTKKSKKKTSAPKPKVYPAGELSPVHSYMRGSVQELLQQILEELRKLNKK